MLRRPRFSWILPLVLFLLLVAMALPEEASAQGAPAYDLKVVVTEIYRNGFQYYRMGYAGAQSVVLLIFVMIMITFQFIIFRKEQ